MPAIMPIGSKSVRGSYCSFGIERDRGRVRAHVAGDERVAVGRGALGAGGGVVPPAPTTFSITSCWPSVRDMCSPMMRAMTSVGPPAANGTISVIVLARIVLRSRGRGECDKSQARAAKRWLINAVTVLRHLA